jgi:two-component system, NtrC family, response regulator HydG
MDLMIKNSWPGNVRELENTMERAVILLRESHVSPEELPLIVQGAATGRLGAARLAVRAKSPILLVRRKKLPCE